MLLNNRVIWKNNTTLTDLSVKLNDFHSGSEVIDIVAADDAIYIGSDLPFNHRYFEVSVPNAEDSALSVSLWDGSDWKPAVEVIDQTQNVTGKTFSKSGIVSWVPDRDETWMYARSTEDIPDLATLKIYDFYWIKITFSDDLTAFVDNADPDPDTEATALSYIGHKFSDDSDLATYYPDLVLTKTLTAFKTGKTNWNEQHIAGAEEIIKDLRKKRIVWSPNQILEWQQFGLANLHKTARLIFTSFGENYKDERDLAEADYHRAMAMQVFNVDYNKNARLEKSEKIVHTGIRRV